MNYIHTDKAPKAVGPYSQAVLSNGILYCSGQIALDPTSGEMVTGGVLEQVKQVCKNLDNVLAAANCTIEHIVKIDIFITNMNDFAEINAEYETWLQENRPARATVEVSRLPKDGLVEISCVAHAPN